MLLIVLAFAGVCTIGFQRLYGAGGFREEFEGRITGKWRVDLGTDGGRWILLRYVEVAEASGARFRVLVPEWVFQNADEGMTLRKTRRGGYEIRSDPQARGVTREAEAEG